MPGVRFGPDGKPVFDIFGIPIVCTTDDAEAECCDPCEAWMNCLKRVPFKLDLAGFDFTEWLPWVRQSPNAYQVDNLAAFNGDTGADEWHGTYVVVPVKNVAVGCEISCERYTGTHPDESDCYSSVVDETCEACGTHRGTSGRSVSTPNSAFGPVSEFYLDLNVECVLNDDEEPCLKFTVLLWFTYETAVNNSLDPLPEEWNTGDALPDFEGCVPGSGCRAVSCCPLLESDLLPLDGLTWGDLTGVVLNPAGLTTPEGACACLDDSIADCMGLMVHSLEQDGGGDGIVNECPVGSYGTVTVDSDTWCCPPPVIVNDPEGNTLSVLAADCIRPIGCGNCRVDPDDRRTPATKVEVDFEYTLGSCCKTFTAVVPDCLGENLLYFWSFGVEGEEVGYCLKNLDPLDVTAPQELVHLTIVNVDTGCIYCAERLVDCSCCEGSTSGNVTAEPTENDCEYRLHLTLSTTDEDCVARICTTTCGDAVPDCIPCFDDDCEFDCAGATLGTPLDAYSAPFTVTGPCTVYWQVWDKECGCAGPINAIPLVCSLCDCCTGDVNTVRMKVSGIVDYYEGCTGCAASINDVWFDLEFNGDSTDQCTWSSGTQEGAPFDCLGDTFTADFSGGLILTCDDLGEDTQWILRVEVGIVDPICGASSRAFDILISDDEKPSCEDVLNDSFDLTDDHGTDFPPPTACFCALGETVTVTWEL